MRWMGLDIGERRIGVALSDPSGLIAQGYKVLERSGSLKQDLLVLKGMVTTEQVEGIVAGLPKNMDGSEGVMAEKARFFGEKLETETGLTVVWWDERLSTRAAERVLLEADLSRRKRKQKIDQVAAAVILQNFLDSQKRD